MILNFLCLLLLLCPALAAQNISSQTDIQHATTSSLPSAQRNTIKPSKEEIAWLKLQAEDPSATKPKNVRPMIKTALVNMLKQDRAVQILISAGNDSFFLKIQSRGSKPKQYFVKTCHETCPAWITMIIEQSKEQAKTDKRNRNIARAIAGTAFMLSIPILKNMQDRRIAQEADAIITYDSEPHYTNDASSSKLVAFQKALKTLLVTTPFCELVPSSQPYGEIEDGVRTFVAFSKRGMSSARNAIDKLCIGFNEANINPQNVIAFTDEQLYEFLTGKFKESTIDLLAQFQHNYMIALGRDGNDDNKTNTKALAIGGFMNQLAKLQTTDPVEVKRILCFCPGIIWQKIHNRGLLSNFTWSPIQTSALPYAITTNRNPQRGNYANFSSLLRDATNAEYCLKDFFPCDFAMFEGLHLVHAKATTE